MNEVIRFALLGLGVGALYAFASQGLIVIYRGTGVLNFALGATAIAGVFMQWELHENGWPFLASAIVGVAWSGFLGALTHWVIMRPLRRASSLVRVIATLGVLITIQAAVVIRYGSNARQVESWLPTDRVTLWGDVGITVDRLILVGIGSASALGLWMLYRSSQFGLATEAVSESERSAAAIGLSPNRIALLNWALGSAIAAVAGILVVPIITLQVTAMTALILAAMAAALIGDFRSFPIATIAGFALGVGQALVGRFSNQEGLGASLPFLVIIVVLVFRGRSLPLRDHYLQQLPMVGNGRIIVGLDALRLRRRRVRDGDQGDEVDRRHHRLVGGGDRPPVDRRADRIRRTALPRPVLDRRLRRLRRGAVGRGVRHPVPPRTAGRRRRRRATRCDLRPAGGANQGDQPGDRHPRPGIHDRADAVQEPQLHRRRPGHPGREPRPVRLRHRVDQPPGPLRDLRVGHGDAGRRRRRQRATWAQRPSTDRRPDQRTGGGGAGDQRDGRQALRLLAGVGHRRLGRHRPGVPAQFDQLPVLQQLHVDHLRRSGTARRGRPAARRVRRFHDGHGGDQPGGPRDDLGGGRQVDPADQRHRASCSRC